MTGRVLVIDATIRIEGTAEPELVLRQRIPWPEDGTTVDDIAADYIRRACRELDGPRWQIVTASTR